MSVETMQRFVFEEGGDGRRSFHLCRSLVRPLSGGRGEVVSATALLLLLLSLLMLPVGVDLLDSTLSGQGGSGRSSQQLEDVQRGGPAQVLPGLLPRSVPQPDVGVELAHQQPDDVFVAVDGGDVEGSVAAGRPGVDVEG